MMSLSDDAQKSNESKIDLAIRLSAEELKRLIKLYRMRGKTKEACEIEDALKHIEGRASQQEIE